MCGKKYVVYNWEKNVRDKKTCTDEAKILTVDTSQHDNFCLFP